MDRINLGRTTQSTLLFDTITMLTVGLTGGIGSGKTQAANLFSNLGVPVIDTDVIAHQLTSKNSPTLQKIISLFGTEYLLPDNELNRSLLAQTVFENSDKRKSLETILHSEIKKSVEEEISNLSDKPYIIVVVPLLFETSFKDLVDTTLVIDSSENEQISRTQKRDGKTAAQIQQIMQHQLPREQRLEYADKILVNSGTLEELNHAVKALHQQYLSTEKG